MAVVFAVLLVCSTTVNVLAAEWDIANGSITIKADANGQTVSQGDVSETDDAPVITGNGASAIHIESSGGATASLTISDLNTHVIDESAINIENGSKVNLTVEGSNYVGSEHDLEDDSFAGIRVGKADLTIDGNGYVYIENYGSAGAVLGSNEYENFDGSITIQGAVELEIDDDGSADGAAIGSGQYADFNRTVHITEDASVFAESPDRGAGIGSGEEGDFNGVIIIDKNARVNAEGSDDSAGIGAGMDGDFTGLVYITDNAEVEAKNDENGSPIGSSNGGDFTGTVIIAGDSIVDLDLDDNNTNTLIGANDTGKNGGKIIIAGNATVWGDGSYDTLGAENIEQISSGSEIILGKDVQVFGSYVDDLEQLRDIMYADNVSVEDVTDEMIQHYIDDWYASRVKDVEIDDFWFEVEQQIRKTVSGETVTVETVGRLAMPGFVMKAVRETGVKLVICTENGEIVVDQMDASLPEAASYWFENL